MGGFWVWLAQLNIVAVLVSLGGGFVIGRAAERFKRSQALAIEIGKERVAAIVRASTVLGRLERRLGRIVGGPVDDMQLDLSHDPEGRWLRERFARDQEVLIRETNEAGDQILADLVVLGPHSAPVLRYHTAIVAVSWAVADPSVPLSRVAELVKEVPKARRALSSLFPRLDAS
jgi:hypothetical protein